MDYLFIVGGLIGLLFGGEYLVRGAVAVATRLQISPMIIGVTLVGFGTSTPELLTSLQAALAGSPGIAIGNVVGSNIANILLILGIAAAIAPIAVKAPGFRRDGAMLGLATVLCLGMVLWGEIGRAMGMVCLAALAGYLVWTIRSDDDYPLEMDQPAAGHSVGVSLLIMAGGLVVTLLAARYLVLGSVAVAADLGVSEAIIGLTIVAIGTSMPELVTSVIAARKGQADLAFGNILGSNIFNILGILGLTVLVKPMTVPAQIAGFDIWVMVAATVALVWMAVSGWRITRGEGWVLLGGYVVYLGWLVAQV